ncbi:hypothetical protein [Streptomyces malaysiensis]
MLIQHLPPESATMTALRNAMSDKELAEQAEQGEPEKARWSQLEQLTALNADLLKQVIFVLICANTESKSKRPKPPEPIARPGAKPPKPKAQLSENSANVLFDLINGGAA